MKRFFLPFLAVIASSAVAHTFDERACHSFALDALNFAQYRVSRGDEAAGLKLIEETLAQARESDNGYVKDDEDVGAVMALFAATMKSEVSPGQAYDTAMTQCMRVYLKTAS